MKFVKLDNLFINLDRVSFVWDDRDVRDGPALRVEFDSGDRGDGHAEGAPLSLRGEERTRLLAWLARESTDLMAPLAEPG